MATYSSATNGNGSKNTVNILIVIAIVSVLGNGITSFLNIANPRGDIAATEARVNHAVDEIKNETKAEFKEIKNNLKDLVSRTEYKEYGIRIDKATDNLGIALKELRDQTVTRPEHQQHWKENDDRVASVAGRVTDITRDYASKDMLKQSATELSNRIDIISQRLTKDEEQTYGTYNPGKQLENLQNQLNDLRRQLNDLIAVMAPPTTRVTPVLPLTPSGSSK